MMHHTTHDGTPKVVTRCTLPLTAPRCVSRLVTDVGGGNIVLREFAPGWDPGRIRLITAAPLEIASDVHEVTLI